MQNSCTTAPDDAMMADLLIERGLRCTRQRLAVYNALRGTKAHPTADQLYRIVRPELSGMSLATVYNTLEVFCKAGLAQKIAGSDGSARYDAATEDHVHLVDTATGKMADVPDGLSERLLKALDPKVLAEIESELGFKVSQVQLELIGEYL